MLVVNIWNIFSHSGLGRSKPKSSNTQLQYSVCTLELSTNNRSGYVITLK